jgi:hypothetical protein
MLYDASVNEVETARALTALARERPRWLPVVEAALAVCERLEPYGGEFAGSWVLDELENRVGRRTWLPNLRVLVTYGLLEKVGDSTRGGRRAYYRFKKPDTVRETLSKLKGSMPEPKEGGASRPRRFRFIGAGASPLPGRDTGRRAGEIRYEPRSWR